MSDLRRKALAAEAAIRELRLARLVPGGSGSEGDEVDVTLYAAQSAAGRLVWPPSA